MRRISEFIGVQLTDDEVKVVVSENTFVNKKKSAGKYHPIYNKGMLGKISVSALRLREVTTYGAIFLSVYRQVRAHL